MKFALTLLLLIPSLSAFAAQVDGYFRKDGTYVPPHYRSNPDSSRSNNWSSQGNVNPYTGERGTVNPYAPPAPTYPTYPTFPSEPRQRSRQ